MSARYLKVHPDNKTNRNQNDSARIALEIQAPQNKLCIIFKRFQNQTDCDCRCPNFIITQMR